MKNLKIITVIIIFLGIAIVFVIRGKSPILSPTPIQTACTEEAKLCPDGSYVGRTGPQCQFSECPAVIVATTTPTTTPPTPKTLSGITGTVLLGPRCPVMRNPPDPQCADRPYQTSLEVTTVDGKRVIAKFSSDTQGKFKVSVPPGEYIIQSTPTTNFYPRCSTNGTILVKTDTFTDTLVSCDTGIR